MSGFFSLDAGIGFGKVQKNLQHHHHHHHQNQHQDQNQDQEHDDSIITPYSLYLFKNEEIYSKNFELWQCYQYQHHHHHQQQQEQQPNYGSKTMRQSGYGSIGNSGMNCQDCGNQAKKDCQHMRCRTCCKSRGFHCQTHVKSTWVPAAKRRERQQQLMSLSQNNISGNQQLSLMMRSATGGDETQTPKRLREDHHHHHHHHDHQRSVTVAGNRTGGGLGVILPASQHHDTSSGLEVGNFPGEVSSPTVFRCVRVSGMDEAEEQLAYQTAVSIGGHVFKGILYDHGPEGRYHQSGEGSSSVAGSVAPLQQLNLITSGTTGIATETANINPAVSFIDPSSTYSTPFSAFMAGTQFFPPPRS